MKQAAAEGKDSATWSKACGGDSTIDGDREWRPVQCISHGDTSPRSSNISTSIKTDSRPGCSRPGPFDIRTRPVFPGSLRCIKKFSSHVAFGAGCAGQWIGTRDRERASFSPTIRSSPSTKRRAKAERNARVQTQRSVQVSARSSTTCIDYLPLAQGKTHIPFSPTAARNGRARGVSKIKKYPWPPNLGIHSVRDKCRRWRLGKRDLCLAPRFLGHPFRAGWSDLA